MNIYKPIIFLISYVLCEAVAQYQGRVKGVPTELLLYESEDSSGAFTSYANNLGFFDDLPYFLETETQMEGVNYLCVESGIFIFYKETGYFANDPDEVRILSGMDKCSPTPPQGIGSLRHAASKWFNFETTNEITFFSELYYSGLLYTVTSKSQRDLQRVQPTHSLMIVGPDSWTVENELGDIFCLRPYQHPDLDKEPDLRPGPEETVIPTYVCLVPNATDVFNGTETEANIYFKKVFKGCDDSISIIQIDTCFDYATGELQEPAVKPIKPETNRPKTKDEGDEGSPFFGLKCKGPYDEIALLIRMRVTNDFVDTYQFLLPLDKQHTWRTELLDASFEVVTKLVGTIIPAWFLGSAREYFIYFSEKNVWSDGKGWPEDKPNKDVLVALHLTKQCYEKAGSWDLLSEVQATVEGIVGAGPINDEDVIKEELRLKKKFDPLTEFVWLSINLVAVTCHRILGFETNYWLDYLTVSSDMYLKPMIEYWQDGDAEEQKYYPIIFGGLNFTRQYQKEAVFATAVYDLVKYSEVFPRPNELLALASRASSGNTGVESESPTEATVTEITVGSRRKRETEMKVSLL